MKRIAVITLISTLLLTAAVAFCEEDEEKEFIVKKAEMTGRISAIMPLYISVSYMMDKEKEIEYDIAFLIDEETRFDRRRREELKMGDKIEIRYEEHYEVMEGGKERFEKRLAKSISFLSPAMTGLRSE